MKYMQKKCYQVKLLMLYEAYIPSILCLWPIRNPQL